MSSFWRVLFNAGLGFIVVGLGAVHALDNGYGPVSTFRFPWLVGFLIVAGVLCYGLGVPELGDSGRSAVSGLLAILGSLLFISAAQAVLGTALLPRSVLLGAVLAVPAWSAAANQVARAGQRHQASRDRVLAVVAPAEAERLKVDLDRGLERALTLVGTVKPEDVGDGLAALAAQSEASILVLGREATDDESIIGQATELHAGGLRVRPLLAFYEEWVGKLPVSELRRSSLLFDISDVHKTTYRRGARVLDLAVSFLASPLLVVVLPIVFVGNLVGNRGPLFFRQSRVGRGGDFFDIYKLRSMTPGSASTEWTAEGDARITAFGQILRTTHVDELPQLINIFRGELSLVGPRPEQPHYVEQLKETIPFYDLRHVVQPGLTGWAQVNYRYGNTEFDALEKLQFEFYYLRHQGLWLDIKIIARTLRSVLGRKGK